MAGVLEWIVGAAPWIAGAAMAALALGVIAWCIAGDRARGRRRCPKCWHDLTATPGLTCSECGFAARSEMDLRRTRRRIGLAAALSIGLFVAALIVRLQVSGESAWSLLPARIPIALLAHLPPRTAPTVQETSMDRLRRMALGGVREELLGRIARGELSKDDIVAIADACTVGHDGAQPGSRAWLESYGDVVAMWLSTGESAYASQPFRTAQFAAVSPTREELDALMAEQDARREVVRPVSERLTALPPIVMIDPAPAPPGSPCIVWLGIRGFLAEGGEVRVRLTPAPPDAIEPIIAAEGVPEPPLRSHAGRWIRWMPSGSGASRLPVVLGQHQSTDGQGVGSASVAIDIAWRSSPDGPWRRSSFTQELPQPSASDTGDGNPLGVSGAALDAAVARAFEDGVVLWQAGELPAAIRFNASATSGPEFEGVAIGLLIDLLEDGVVRRRTRIWWPGGDPTAGSLAGWEPPEEDIDALRRLASDPESSMRWSMRVRSDPDMARRATSVSRPSYWEGELLLPIRPRPRSDAAPYRRFTFVEAPTDAGPAPIPSDP